MASDIPNAQALMPQSSKLHLHVTMGCSGLRLLQLVEQVLAYAHRPQFGGSFPTPSHGMLTWAEVDVAFVGKHRCMQ